MKYRVRDGNHPEYGSAKADRGAHVPGDPRERAARWGRWGFLSLDLGTLARRSRAKVAEGAVIKQCPDWSGVRVAARNEKLSREETRDRLRRFVMRLAGSG